MAGWIRNWPVYLEILILSCPVIYNYACIVVDYYLLECINCLAPGYTLRMYVRTYVRASLHISRALSHADYYLVKVEFIVFYCATI